MSEKERRKPLSDEEVQKIANRLYERFTKDLFINAGKGFLGFVWKGVIYILILLAAYYLGSGKA